jgi:hypothetical protein
MSAIFPDGRDDLNEGHGFSRAVDGMKAGRLQPLRYGFLQGNLCVDLNMAKDVPQGLKPSMAAAFYGTAKAVPLLRVLYQATAQAMCLKYSERGQRGC